MKLKTKSAKLFFVICTKQFMNGIIKRQTYKTYLESLFHIMDPGTRLYTIVLELLDRKKIPASQSAADDNFSEERDAVLVSIIKENPDCLLFQVTLRIADPDPSPSIPHIHIYDKGINRVKKINVYTGESTEGASYSKNELISLWNDSWFLKRMSKNLDAICSKRSCVSGKSSGRFI